jgi:hypothetical protein
MSATVSKKNLPQKYFSIWPIFAPSLSFLGAQKLSKDTKNAIKVITKFVKHKY